jgi:hypothetical protein
VKVFEDFAATKPDCYRRRCYRQTAIIPAIANAKANGIPPSASTTKAAIPRASAISERTT